ncbi:hypothetical protein E2C01_073729 [Portunus trituberculatus]|uniref:Uncharacterized protein n=1 Tax=Portunus trituberculatus TaxID=210409 RepID=A0A5B7IA84_PORTR|nr:hypothetical protein [Portunus trituberculatus]
MGDEFGKLWVLIGIGDCEEGGHGSHRRPLQFILLLVLLFDRVGLHFGGHCGPQGFHESLQSVRLG